MYDSSWVNYLAALLMAALMMTQLHGAAGKDKASDIFELYGEEPELSLQLLPSQSSLPADAAKVAGAEELTAGRKWALDLYVVSENVETFSSPFLRSGLYQHTPHQHDSTEVTELTKAFASGSLNIVGVSLSTGLITFFQSFESVPMAPRGETSFANLFKSVDTHDSFFIVYTHQAAQETAALSQLLQWCEGSSV